MAAVLGLDVAWTPGGSSGAALAARLGHGWQCLAVAPGYGLFCDLAHGRLAAGDQWPDQAGRGPAGSGVRHVRPQGGEADVPALLAACRALLAGAGRAGEVTVVAVDMPLSPTPLPGRRVADNEASRALGRYGCAVHSPTEGRPGALGAALTNGFLAQGFPLAVGGGDHPKPALLEVYPHAELVGLQREVGGVARNALWRCAYKASRSLRYWPDVPKDGRIAFLLHNFEVIRDMLGQVLGLPALPLPPGTTLAGLKPYEDCLDALACCATGIRYLEGRARALGDADGAIWVPDGI
ncbi:MAG: DUF429 domain-containing protein [Solidesulfovibrio sp. DCME]|uniref:DUF429 domain-containing protein n=1 Tax=Solidesulfovibrio sp. DCME TaxID=3447380 RepID=UPI003D137C6D